MTPSRSSAASTMVAALLAAPAGASVIEVIFSEVPGHPTAQVPGARDLDGNLVETEFKAMEILSVSPDGTQWILKSRNWLGDQLETMLLLGAGASGDMLAQEGQPVHDGAEGELYEFFGSGPPRFDELGRFVYTARARGGDSTRKQKGIFFDGADFHMVRQESDPALGLIDLPPDDSGDELFGNSFGSMHLLNDGAIGSHDTTIQNIHSSRRPAVFYDDDAFMQTGVTMIEGRLWDGFDLNDFYTTPDGATWYIRGDDDGPTDSDDILVKNGAVLMREGSAIGDSSVVMADVFYTHLSADGTCWSRGDDPADDDWAARDDVVMAATGDHVVGGAGLRWGDSLVAFTGNRRGDWVLAGSTDDPDPAIDSVIALNGTAIVVREGDPVDLDGNGQNDDDAFIGRGDPTLAPFRPDDVYLTDDGVLYFLASLRDSEGNDLGSFGSGGDALLRLVLRDCPEDIDGSGDVDFDDLLAVLSAWGPCKDCPEDIDGSGDVGFDDLLAVLSAWGPCE